MKSVLVRPSVLIRTALTAKNSESYTKKSNVPKSMKGAETRAMEVDLWATKGQVEGAGLDLSKQSL